MDRDFTTILTAAALVLAAGCVTAGTWVNGCYIDGPLCTVCDGTMVVTHAYGTTVCTHCDGTGIEPSDNEVIVVENTIVENYVILDTVICDTWCPPPPPPPPRYRSNRHMSGHRNPPRHGRSGCRPTAKRLRPAAKQSRPAAKPAVRPAAPRGGGRRR